MSFLCGDLFLVLEHVSFDEVPVLELFFLHGFFSSSPLDLLTLLLMLELLDFGQRDAKLVLLGQDVKQVTFLLDHADFKLAVLFLLSLHHGT